jgi:hypothetical protein
MTKRNKLNNEAQREAHRHVLKLMVEQSIARKEPVSTWQLLNYEISPPPGYIEDPLSRVWHFNRIDLRPLFGQPPEEFVVGLNQTRRFLANVVRGFVEG